MQCAITQKWLSHVFYVWFADLYNSLERNFSESSQFIGFVAKLNGNFQIVKKIVCREIIALLKDENEEKQHSKINKQISADLTRQFN